MQEEYLLPPLTTPPLQKGVLLFCDPPNPWAELHARRREEMRKFKTWLSFCRGIDLMSTLFVGSVWWSLLSRYNAEINQALAKNGMGSLSQMLLALTGLTFLVFKAFPLITFEEDWGVSYRVFCSILDVGMIFLYPILSSPLALVAGIAGLIPALLLIMGPRSNNLRH
jgi:hypothetical protein